MANVLILEDNPTFSARLETFLVQWELVTGVTIVEDLKQFFELPRYDAFDFFLADLRLPDGNALGAIEHFQKKSGGGMTIVVSSIVDSVSILSAIKAGAVGYLQKSDEKFQIISALQEAIKGGSPITPGIANTIFRSLHQLPLPYQISTPDAELLTPKEKEVLTLIGKGLSYNEVADILMMSKNTVPVHIRNIYKKMQATNRSEAVYEARVRGIIV